VKTSRRCRTFLLFATVKYPLPALNNRTPVAPWNTKCEISVHPCVNRWQGTKAPPPHLHTRQISLTPSPLRSPSPPSPADSSIILQHPLVQKAATRFSRHLRSHHRLWFRGIYLKMTDQQCNSADGKIHPRLSCHQFPGVRFRSKSGKHTPPPRGGDDVTRMCDFLVSSKFYTL